MRGSSPKPFYFSATLTFSSYLSISVFIRFTHSLSIHKLIYLLFNVTIFISFTIISLLYSPVSLPPYLSIYLSVSLSFFLTLLHYLSLSLSLSLLFHLSFLLSLFLSPSHTQVSLIEFTTLYLLSLKTLKLLISLHGGGLSTDLENKLRTGLKKSLGSFQK